MNSSSQSRLLHQKEIMGPLTAHTHLSRYRSLRVEQLPNTFCRFYAFLAGFKFAVKHSMRTTAKKRDNEIIKVELKCTHSGKAHQRKSTEEEEAEVDKRIGKKTSAKRNTNV